MDVSPAFAVAVIYGYTLDLFLWIFNGVTFNTVLMRWAMLIVCDIATFNWSTIRYSSFHNVGLGTIVTTVINAPIITLMGKLVDKIFGPDAKSPKLKKVLKRS